MAMKRALLASSAVLLAGAGNASADGLYANIFAGVNFQQGSSGFQQTVSSFTSTGYNLDGREGFLIGGTIGTDLNQWVQGLRIEGEVSWRNNDSSGRFFATTVLSSGSAGAVEANLSTFSLLANLWYDFDIGENIKPYVGGGVGFGWTNGEVTFYPATLASFQQDFDDSGFVWQLGAGFKYPLNDSMQIGVGYRYFRGPDIDNNVFLGKNDLPITHERDNHSVTLEMTFDLN